MPAMPNIVFLFADDQRFDTIAALGNPHIRTPHLDTLTARGTAFTHAHIPGGTSGAVCMPSRAMLHSGRSLFRLEGAGDSIPDTHSTLGEVLRAKGYRTFGAGKWHNGREAFARGFSDGAEIFFGGMSDHWNVPVYDFDPTGRYDATCPLVENPFRSKAVTLRQCSRIVAGKHSTDLLGDAAVAFLESPAAREEPFFLYVSFLAPHDPRLMPERFRKMYRDADLPLPENFLRQHPFDAGVHQIRDEILADYPRKPEQVREHIADYYAMITHLDDAVGRILAAIDRAGQTNNTIVVFAADNGLALGSHGLFGKQNLYDHSVRVPLLFAGPGIPAGERRDTLCFHYDLYPTLCELAGAPVPDGVDGVSLVPSIRSANHPAREELYLAYTSLHRGIRTRRWKLIEYHVADERHTQVFDLEKDPFENRNLAEDSAAAGIVAALRERLKTLRNQSGDLDTQWGRKFWDEHAGSVGSSRPFDIADHAGGGVDERKARGNRSGG